MGMGNPRHIACVCLRETLASSPSGSQWSFATVRKDIEIPFVWLTTKKRWKVEPRPHWWEVSAVITATPLLPKQWRIQERGPPPLIFRPNWGPKGLKKMFWETTLPTPFIQGSGWPGLPRYLKVWIQQCQGWISKVLKKSMLIRYLP